MLLKVEHLTYKVDNRTILDDINLNINKGDTIAIVGPSGSGKSTLLKQLNHLISPTSGDLYLNDQSYFNYKPEEIRTRVSYLMQQSELIGYTIEDNMKFPAEARSEAFDRDKAKQLMYEPEVLLLDEATSALDTHNKKKIEEIIFKLADKGIAILWITHSDDQSMRHFKRRITITDGKISSDEELNGNE